MYLIDANVFIEAKRRYYAFDLAPGFWEALIAHSQKQEIFSIDKVKGELDKGRDDLTSWCANSFHTAFISSDDPSVIEEYSQIVNWVYSNSNYTQSAKNEFANVADGWVIATAKAKKYTVVSHESHKARGKVKMPPVCNHFKVQIIDTFEMLRRLNVKLIR